MEIVADAVLAYPRPRVFATYRDGLVDLAPFLPNIRSIEQIQRTEKPGEVHVVNEWKGGGDIPAVARSVISESMLRWTDHATWVEADFHVDWRTDIHAFPGAVRCEGKNRYVEIPGGTRLEIRGHFTVDASKVPGVPKLFAKTVGSAVEKFMVAQIARNTTETVRGLEKLLAKQA